MLAGALHGLGAGEAWCRVPLSGTPLTARHQAAEISIEPKRPVAGGSTRDRHPVHDWLHRGVGSVSCPRAALSEEPAPRCQIPHDPTDQSPSPSIDSASSGRNDRVCALQEYRP